MKLLAIDTATKAASAAIVSSEGIIGEIGLNIGKTHSQKFLPGVEQLLSLCDMALSDMDGFAVTVGPGSFTGVRIGLATAKAWSYGLDKPVVGVNTLDALAGNVDCRYVCPILDARRNEFYTCLYDGGKPIWDYLALSPLALVERLRLLDGTIAFVGDAVAGYQGFLSEQLGERAYFPNSARQVFMAVALGSIAMQKLEQGEVQTALEIGPFYLRASEAEIKMQEKLQAQGK
ncbi:MAG: tRNA (adenosine(37)-N6)-threonylcarbamoyltransferase complex dimerization subunit type 1 TsaB [Peptococcaceae bacterium]|jgi:tRNA threonylcarbamoyladenosine biosynthesis protein TsaB|nr:tRNA (adenosine(37)-N6)-threonylcarbamoyltransferase complex dimerization subunit type 1 TsaB [Peptococcaceae bacterium]